jgi:hypothetical protein
MPLEFNMPVTKLVTPALQPTLPVAWTLEMPQNLNLGKILVQLVLTKAATGAATKSIPAVADAVSMTTLKINGNPDRTRAPGELWGQAGENFLNDKNSCGTVQYFQAGVAITAALNGITYGNAPVTIGSAQDLAIQAALANNTATVAVFGLPYLFSEDFRKAYLASAAMALPTAFGDGKGNVVGGIGGVILELAMNAQPGGAGNLSNVAIAANVEYDKTLAKQGIAVRMLKQKRLNKAYTAVGDLEVADQIKNIAGEACHYILLTTGGDAITKVVVKQGTDVKRTMSWEDNILSLRTAGVNVDNITRSMFPICWRCRFSWLPHSVQGMMGKARCSAQRTRSFSTTLASGRITIWPPSSLTSFGGIPLSLPPKNMFKKKVCKMSSRWWPSAILVTFNSSATRYKMPRRKRLHRLHMVLPSGITFLTML